MLNSDNAREVGQGGHYSFGLGGGFLPKKPKFPVSSIACGRKVRIVTMGADKFHAFAGCGVGIDHGASETLKRLHLPREVLLLRADARVADQPFSGLRFETHL